MSKEFKNMDDLFQAAFADESMEVPAFVKTEIDKRIGFKNRQNRWFGLSTITLLLLIGVGVSWSMWNASADTKTDTAVLSAGDVTNINLISEKASADEKTIHAHNSNQNTENASSEIIISKTNQQTDLSINETNPTNSAGMRNQTFSLQNSSVNDQKADKELSDRKITMDGSSANDKKSGTAANDLTANSLNDEAFKSSNDAIIYSPDNRTTDQQNNSMLRNQNVYSRGSMNLNARMEELNAKQLDLSKTNQPASPESPLKFPFQSSAYLADANNIERSERYNPWMISGTTGVNFSQSKYTFPSEAEKTNYLNSTYSVPGFEANLDVKYRLKNSLTFGTGAGVSQLVENYSFFKESLTVDSTSAWFYTPIYDTLDTMVIVGYDSTLTTTMDTSNVTLYDVNGTSRATYLTIPFSIGTQIIRNKFRFDVYLMGRFNYLINGKGGYLQDDTFTTFNKNENQIFKQSYFDLMAGAAIHYEIFTHLYLTGTFRFHPALGNMYDNLSFNRKIQSYHVGFGVSWKL